jgi:hypothetical protein
MIGFAMCGSYCTHKYALAELEKLLKPQKKTGYERVDENCEYYYEHCEGGACRIKEYNSKNDDASYECANYYSDKTVAENNARADKLMRQFRRFAVEHRETELDWQDVVQDKYFIYYNHKTETLGAHASIHNQTPCIIYFDSLEAAKLAVETFHDELIWYFTEYKDSL